MKSAPKRALAAVSGASGIAIEHSPGVAGQFEVTPGDEEQQSVLVPGPVGEALVPGRQRHLAPGRQFGGVGKHGGLGQGELGGRPHYLVGMPQQRRECVEQ